MAANRGPTIPNSAFADNVPYSQGRNDRWPSMNFNYKYYTRVRNFPAEDFIDGAAALAEAQRICGPHVRVLRTARHWVAYSE